MRSSLFFALLSAMLFGVSTPFSKILLEETNPFQLAGLMYIGAGLGLMPVFLLRGSTPVIPRTDKRNLLRILGMIVCGGLFGPVFLLFGLQLASASSVSLWLNFELLATAVLGYLFFHDHLQYSTWAGVALGVTAGILLSIHEGSSGLRSGLMVLIACSFWGLDNHFTALIDGITAVHSTIIKGISAGVVNFALGCAFSGWNPRIFFLAALFVGFVSYGLSVVLYILSAQKLGATRSQVIFSSAPFFGLFFSILLLHEHVAAIQLLSALLMVFSVALIIVEKHGHAHTHYPIVHAHPHNHDDLHHRHEQDGNQRDTSHTHSHVHEEITHSHPHWPDIHHRHEHGNRQNHHE